MNSSDNQTDPAGDPANQRVERRFKVFLAGQLQIAGEGSARAHALNLSRSGALVYSAEECEVGDDVLLELDGLQQSARVTWKMNGRLGLQFDRLLKDQDIDQAIG